MSLDIVIVSFNARDALAGCLRSIRADATHGVRRVFVVDNASTDGSAAVVGDVMPDACLVRNPTNVGFARANNIGIRQGQGALILLLNSDTLVARGRLDQMVEALAQDAHAAALGPRLIDGEGRVELSWGRMVSPWNEAWQKTLGALYARGIGPAERLVQTLTTTRRYVDWVSGACLLVRRTDAESVGLLDERYFMYGEDVDFCAALRARGRRVLFWPAVEVQHLRGRSRRAAPRETAVAYRRSQLAFYAKHHPSWYPLLAAYLRLKGAWPGESSDVR